VQHNHQDYLEQYADAFEGNKKVLFLPLLELGVIFHVTNEHEVRSTTSGADQIDNVIGFRSSVTGKKHADGRKDRLACSLNVRLHAARDAERLHWPTNV
jgi:hypothetical protein